MNSWVLLGAAIIAEVLATSALKSTQGFTRITPSVVVIAGYVISIYLLSLTLKSIPVGIAYAIWAGLGIVLIALIAWQVHGQRLDMPAIIGMAMIIGGTVIINLLSKSTGT
jgi:small multidrug resistance pump